MVLVANNKVDFGKWCSIAKYCCVAEKLQHIHGKKYLVSYLTICGRQQTIYNDKKKQVKNTGMV